MTQSQRAVIQTKSRSKLNDATQIYLTGYPGPPSAKTTPLTYTLRIITIIDHRCRYKTQTSPPTTTQSEADSQSRKTTLAPKPLSLQTTPHRSFVTPRPLLYNPNRSFVHPSLTSMLSLVQTFISHHTHTKDQPHTPTRKPPCLSPPQTPQPLIRQSRVTTTPAKQRNLTQLCQMKLTNACLKAKSEKITLPTPKAASTTQPQSTLPPFSTTSTIMRTQTIPISVNAPRVHPIKGPIRGNAPYL